MVKKKCFYLQSVYKIFFLIAVPFVDFKKVIFLFAFTHIYFLLLLFNFVEKIQIWWWWWFLFLMILSLLLIIFRVLNVILLFKCQLSSGYWWSCFSTSSFLVCKLFLGMIVERVPVAFFIGFVFFSKVICQSSLQSLVYSAILPIAWLGREEMFSHRDCYKVNANFQLEFELGWLVLVFCC